MRSLVAAMLYFAVPSLAAVDEGRAEQLQADGVQAVSFRAGEDRSDAALIALGETLYHVGTGLKATVSGAPLPPRMAACVRCHRPSGYGGGEGDARAASIAADDLFAPLTPRRDRLLRELYQERYGTLAKHAVRIPRSRPAYNGAGDLGTALRKGDDSAGQALSSNMPRYEISNREVAALTAYLNDMGEEGTAGHDAKYWHLATIFAPGVPLARRKAATDVIQAFVERHNREVQREIAREGFSPYYKAEYAGSRRLLRIDTWQLRGPSSTWATQLDRFHDAQPPFAVVGGIVPLNYEPVARFCERRRVPCVFPQTEAPGGRGEFSLHYSQGLAQEAQLILDDLRTKAIHDVALFVGSSPEARHLASELMRRAEGRLDIVDARQARAALVLAQAEEAENLLRDLPPNFGWRPIYLAGGLVADEAGEVALRAERDVAIAWRFSLPGMANPNKQRLRSWLRKRQILNPKLERTQFETWFALEVTRHAMLRLVDRASRPFFIETVEHMTESISNPLIYPELSLGPSQRFASTSGRLLRLGP